jgi:hypothetical protein
LGFRFGVRLVFAAVAGAPGDGGAAAMDDGCGARAEGGVFGFWYRQGFGAGSLPFAFGPFVRPERKISKHFYKLARLSEIVGKFDSAHESICFHH